ncbi:hypothetical protein OGAPHI_001060 [Ogataea philodendri]|uniref:Monopolin complex subunit Csm1/Pcs1 C-terminal domain-containing protein n=1 Tax=Ogataea philodendri TaxID=1378263 RepID=A0A9P8PF83_9ASCO|nr:uncharacterized protein OGAPHI_001060 [Ogataea philodendri]KAH3670545.1 hypothetical protein OGAPHI_001060 [Ogataea philodendri]
MAKRKTTKRAESPSKRTTRSKPEPQEEKSASPETHEEVDPSEPTETVEEQKENVEPEQKKPEPKPDLKPTAALFTPSKRLFDTPDRSTLLSPTRTRPEFKLPSEATISQLFQRKDLKALTNILNDLTSSKPERMFQDYKKLSERKQQASETLISNLTKENQKLRTGLKSAQTDKTSTKEIEQLKRQVDALKKENARLVAEHESQSAKRGPAQRESKMEEAVAELDLVGTKLEIMELLTGLSCLEYTEDSENMIFKMKQAGETCTLIYQLLISKLGAGEIVYIPILEHGDGEPDLDSADWAENLDKLGKVLPEYLLDNLTFPSSTLYNFYNKLGRSLNKKVE